MYSQNATLAQGEYYYGYLCDIPKGSIVETRNLQSCIGLLLQTPTRYLLAHVDKDEGLEDILKDNNAQQFFSEMMQETGIKATLVGGDYPVFSSSAIEQPSPNKSIETLKLLKIPYIHQHYSREISLPEAIITALALTLCVELSRKSINHLLERSFVFIASAIFSLIAALRQIQHSTYKLSINNQGKINVSLTSTWGFPQQENIAGLTFAQQRNAARRLVVRSGSIWEERYLPLTLFNQNSANEDPILRTLDGNGDLRRLLAFNATQRKYYLTEFTHVEMLTDNASKPTTIPNNHIVMQYCNEGIFKIFWQEYGEIIERQMDIPSTLTTPKPGQKSSDATLIRTITDQFICIPSNDPNICKTTYAKLKP